MEKNKNIQIDKETARECINASSDLQSKIFYLDSLFWALNHINWEELGNPRDGTVPDTFPITVLGELGCKISTECLESTTYLETHIKNELEKVVGEKEDSVDE